MPNQWQGKHEDVRVIGDRKTGATAIQLFKEPRLLTDLQEVIDVPLRFICVARNPFDTLSTTLKKTDRRSGEITESHLERQIAHYFERCLAVTRLIDELGADNVKIVLHEALIADPRNTLADLCNFLGVATDRAYLEDCARIVKPRPNIARAKIAWPPDLVDAVLHRVQQIPWLQHYAFEE